MNELVNLDAERSIIGAVLSHPDAIADLADLLPHEAFGDRSCRAVYKAMLNLWARLVPADFVTVPKELIAMGGKSEAAAFAFLDEIKADYFPGAYVTYHAEIVLEMARRRAAVDAGSALVKTAYQTDPDLDETLAGIRRSVDAFRPKPNAAVTQAEQAAAVRAEAEARWRGDLIETVIATGMHELDRMLNGGVRPGEFFVLAARPAMGKSSVALHMARRRRALVVSLEMPWKMLQYRLIAAEAGVPYSVGVSKIGDLKDRERWLEASEVIEALPVTITDTLRTTAAIESESKRLGVEVVVIDHIGRLSDPFKGGVSGYERMSALSWRCKEMALRSGLAVVGLSQLNREVEHRQGCLPFLSDLRESGRIEEDADHVALLYNRLYYARKGMGGLEPKPDLDYITGTNWERLLVQLVKNRNGVEGNVELGWQAEAMRVRDPEERWAA